MRSDYFSSVQGKWRGPGAFRVPASRRSGYCLSDQRHDENVGQTLPLFAPAPPDGTPNPCDTSLRFRLYSRVRATDTSGAAILEWIDSNTCFPRRTFSMMASGSAVQVKGFGLSLVSARYRLMAACRSTMPVKTPRLSRCLVSLAKNPSTALSQEAEVGVKWKWKRLCRSSQARTLGCLCVESLLAARA